MRPAAGEGFDRRSERGPFDIIGDVHGCADELEELLARLGYGARLAGEGEGRRAEVGAPAGRRLVFVGDFMDRGPRSPDVMRIAMAAVEGGLALAVPGNHDDKFIRWVRGNPVKIGHGLGDTIEQMQAESPAFRASAAELLDGLPAYLWLEAGELVVAHAGIRERMLGRLDRMIRSFCLYGDNEGGRTGPDGLPIRYNWAADYDGAPLVVYGHTPVAEPAWQGNSVCIDTGCCFGGALTALRWPERETVSVPARRAYAPLKRAFGLPPRRE
jgi:protein phosphatase